METARYLPDVTLCCVDTRMPAAAVRAIRRSMRGISYGDTCMVTDASSASSIGDDLRTVTSETIQTTEQYSRFMMTGLQAFIRTSHVLIVQWDGFVLTPSAWREEFLQYDYIGAPWPGESRDRAVGNGGFSLRSQRLMTALRDPAMKLRHPEDLCICQDNRPRLEQEHGIRFAPIEVAAQFSYELQPPVTTTFGFHGAPNLIDVLTAEELLQIAHEIPASMTFSTRPLIKALVYRGHFDAAEVLLRKRIGAGDRRWRILSLWLRLQFRRRFGLSSK